MTWLLTTVLCVLLVEIVLRLPLSAIVSQTNKIGRKSLRVLGAKSVSDHWKEKVLLAYSVSLFASTLKLASCLLAIAAGAVFIIFVFDYFGASVGEFITTWTGVGFSLVVASLYLMVRKFCV